jgi:pantothenate kinase
VLWFWVGLLGFAVIGFAALFGGAAAASAAGPAQIAVAALIILISAIPAVIFIRRGRVALGSGLLAGYVLATVASGGQCTYLTGSQDYDALGGAIIYILTLGGVLVLATVIMIVEAIRRRT